MKKIVLTLLSFFFLIAISPVLAVAPPPATTIVVNPPPGFGINPQNTSLSEVFTSALRIVFIVATILVLIYLIWGAFQWITSGGDKENVGKARSRITAALVGLAILALAFFILKVVGSIINIDITNSFTIPKLGNPVPLN